jgi:hypothetical protein
MTQLLAAWVGSTLPQAGVQAQPKRPNRLPPNPPNPVRRTFERRTPHPSSGWVIRAQRFTREEVRASNPHSQSRSGHASNTNNNPPRPSPRHEPLRARLQSCRKSHHLPCALAPEVRLAIPKPTPAPEGANRTLSCGTTKVAPLSNDFHSLRTLQSLRFDFVSKSRAPHLRSRGPIHARRFISAWVGLAHRSHRRVLQDSRTLHPRSAPCKQHRQPPPAHPQDTNR